MTWHEEMLREALALALPDWPYTAGDVIDVDADYERDYSDRTLGEGFTITVTVRRGEERRTRFYEQDGAATFFNTLMTRAARKETA